MIYVYALTDLQLELEPTEGLRDSPVDVLRFPWCTALVTSVTGVPEPDELNLKRHEDVIERAMKSASVIPLRYGQTFADETALAAVIESAKSAVNELLDSFRDKIEVGVRGLLLEDQSDPSATNGISGREYMQERLKQEVARRDRTDKHSEIGQGVHRRLEAIAVDSRVSVGITERVFMSSAYLIDEKDINLFLERLHAIEEQLPAGTQLMCTGPWPPYSFADIDFRVGESHVENR
jgi:hypothetical protein